MNKTNLRLVKVVAGIALFAGCSAMAVAAEPAGAKPDLYFAPSGPVQLPLPWIGSWFGKAEQLCVSAATCQNVVLLMTPTLTSDGGFVANDTLELFGAPFGPHTGAHGGWIATSSTSFIADYIFLLPASTATATAPATVTPVRARWETYVQDYNTLYGFVNVFLGAPIPLSFDGLTSGTFPVLSGTALFPLTPQINYYQNPSQCPSGPPACPLVFAFTIERVTP